ncbi:Uncharacterised protein [Mycobacteroides abscessus subsp. massiliense]|nr:Uncharacterised protein [Mycobacteroides abscessus subsp. massiliense]
MVVLSYPYLAIGRPIGFPSTTPRIDLPRIDSSSKNFHKIARPHSRFSRYCWRQARRAIFPLVVRGMAPA